jgi:hypothetical protein
MFVEYYAVIMTLDKDGTLVADCSAPKNHLRLLIMPDIYAIIL